MGARVRVAVATAAALLATTAAVPGPAPAAGSPAAGRGAGAAAQAASPALVGAFSRPLSEPGKDCPKEPPEPMADPYGGGEGKHPECKPAAVSVVVLPDGRVLYWDGLEGTERVRYSTTLEYGDAAGNGESRLLDISHLSRLRWSVPTPADGGANRNGYEATYLVPDAPGPLGEVFNDPGHGPGSLFCTGQVLLASGDVLAAGGTAYYAEPHVPGTGYGFAELEGLPNARIFRPGTDRWVQTGSMHHGRWYPTLVTLGDGRVFVAGGVTKLIKPLYSNDPAASGRNVVQTETYDPARGDWTENGPDAERSLPLYARLHLLPDGRVYYDAGGQVYSPFGQSYDELTWNTAAAYDPATRSWSDVGIPVYGFLGSTFSVMLELEPPYDRAQFLSAGGVLGTTPGGYVATTLSRINTVDVRTEEFTSTPTSPLTNARWFSTAVLLPTGEVFAVSGADRDEVVQPGSGFAVTQAELFDPRTGEWTPVASAHRQRTYHNTATLLPDGRVLVGGHAPIPNGYGAHQTTPGGFSPNFRDPSFEIYSPPYLFRGPRPVIRAVEPGLGYGESFRITTPDAERIESVVLVRNTALTHLVDADQRSVRLRILDRDGDTLIVKAPPSGNVAPPGPYLLFLNARTPKGPVPSVARQVFVGGQVPSWLRAAFRTDP